MRNKHILVFWVVLACITLFQMVSKAEAWGTFGLVGVMYGAVFGASVASIAHILWNAHRR